MPADRRLTAAALASTARAADASTPTVFVRILSTPPGLPWDQARMAGLDAHAGAPLPMNELVYRLRRLEPWNIGRPARYAVCYVRARDAGDRLIATVVADGRPLTLEFVSGAERVRKARLLGLLAAAAVATGLLTSGAVGSALALRVSLAGRLLALGPLATDALRRAKAIQARKEDAHALSEEHLRGQSVTNFLSDLAWVSRMRASGAHIDVLHWDHGYMALETRGDTAPFGQTDRPTIKSNRPVRSGVWLWGIGPPATGAGHGTERRAVIEP